MTATSGDRPLRADVCPCSVTTVTKPDSGLSYRSWFADEYVAWLNDWLDPIEAEVLACEIHELGWRVGRRDAGQQYARLLGLPAELAPVVAVMVLSLSRRARLRAGDLVGRALLQGAREVA